MVIIGPTTVAAESVQFACQKSIGAAVILNGVKDGYSIGRQGNGTPEEIVLGRHWRFCRYRLERDTPDVVASVGLSYRNLLLPRSDAYHHLMIGDAVGFHIEILFVPGGLYLGGKGVESGGLGGFGA